MRERENYDRTLSAEKQNFKKFKLNNEQSRLEFISHNLGYQIKYDDKDFGILIQITLT